MKPTLLLALAALGNAARAEVAHGILVDESGKPLAGAVLTGYAVTHFGESYASVQQHATTGSTGTFVLDQAPTKPTAKVPILLMARLADGRLSPVRLDAEGGRAVWKEVPRATLTVRAADAEGKPVQGLTVDLDILIVDGIPQNASAEAVRYVASLPGTESSKPTDTQGNVRFTGLPVGARVTYRAKRDGFLSVNDGLQLGPDGAEEKVALLRGAILSGKVLREGKPVPDVSVVASTLVDHSIRQARAKTDMNGEYRIADAFPGGISLSADLGPLAEEWVASGPEGIRLLPGQERNGLNLTLDHGVLLRGQVLTKDGGKPVPKATVNVSAQLGGYFRRTTDAQGRFTARVSEGEWYVSTEEVAGVRLNGQVYLTTTVDAAHNPPLELRVPDTALLSPLPHLGGKVVDAAGKPVPKATVRNLRSHAETTTDVTGRFRFDVPTTPGDLVVAVKGDAMSKRATAILDKPSVTLALDGKSASFRGMLTDDDGKPISGAEVTLGGQMDKGYYDVPGTTTDASGAYRFEGLYGGLDSFFLWAKKPGYGSVTIQPIKATPGERKTLPTQKMALADGTIDGTVVGTDGKPVAGVTVSSQVQEVPTVQTDEGGRFHFAGVPRGKHYVVASRTNAFGSGAEATTGQKDVVIQLKPEPKPIPGLVTGDRTGHAAPEIKVAEWTNNGSVDLKALKGKIVVIDLWAVWCGPCVESLADVQKLSQTYGPKGVTVIGIHAPGTPKDQVAKFVKDKGLTYPVAIDVAESSGAGVTAKAFGYSGIPHMLVIDAKGQVVADTSEVEDVEKAVRRLLEPNQS